MAADNYKLPEDFQLFDDDLTDRFSEWGEEKPLSNWTKAMSELHRRQELEEEAVAIRRTDPDISESELLRRLVSFRDEADKAYVSTADYYLNQSWYYADP